MDIVGEREEGVRATSDIIKFLQKLHSLVYGKRFRDSLECRFVLFLLNFCVWNIATDIEINGIRFVGAFC